MSEYSHFTTPDREYAELFATIPYRAPSKDIQIIREIVDKQFIGRIQEHFRPHLPPESKYRVVDHAAPLSDGGSTLVRTITPTLSGIEEELPCLVWVHGGGFTAGNIGYDDFRMRIACVEFRMAVALIEYRLAPEHQFPVPLNDCYDGLKWVADNAYLFGASLSKGFVIGGTSAGANLVATLVHRARDDPFFEGRHLTGQFLQIPAVVHPDAYPEKYKSELLSINVPEEYKKMTILTKEMVYEMYNQLCAPANDPEVSPLLYPSHAGLPWTFIQVAGLDPLRDEGVLYEKILRESGVKTRLCIYPGVPHGFNIAFPNLKASQKYETDMKEGLKWLLTNA